MDKLVDVIDSLFVNPFSVKKTPIVLIKIATGVHATDEIERSLTKCLDRGADMFERFGSGRFVKKSNRSGPPEKKQH